MHSEDSQGFSALGLNEPIARALAELGYEVPTPIQAQSIPALLAGRDLIGQAQTGTGKTAAFALPLLQRLDPNLAATQALVLTPTRELAIQVAEAVHAYARHLGRVRVLPVYGGDSIQKQVARLRAGVHMVVGTPGRVMDHLRRGTLDAGALHSVVLDEADEMLRMGFIEDVEWILEQTPAQRQLALFSATMPREVRRIAQNHLREPVNVEVRHKTLTVPSIEQFYIQVPPTQKLDALTHLLEVDAASEEVVLVFARTKLGAADLAGKLQARGYAAEAMHGDMNQQQREAVVRRMRGGQVEIVVATDVAARGLDVEQVGRVINFDIPNDPESYVHRIGRTGRAGRAGTAILFVAPRETRMLREIERYSGQRMKPKKVPTQADVAARRMALFKQRLMQAAQEEGLEPYLTLVEELAQESGRDMAELAAAAARMAAGEKPLTVSLEPPVEEVAPGEPGMVRLFIAAGRRSGVRPADIVGAIANEAGVPGREIGSIDIYDAFTFVDVPEQYREQVLQNMTRVRIRNQPANLRLATARDAQAGEQPAPREPTRKGGFGAAGPRRQGGERGAEEDGTRPLRRTPAHANKR
ncbi:MAG: DEAD/DEAH box helicase [Burkholderiales bacterium]|nr:DEAD/DEAH box helicase [Burkholderiales bacterium]